MITDKFLAIAQYIPKQISPIGEVAVIALSVVIFMLLHHSHAIRDFGVILVGRMLFLCFLAASLRMFQYVVCMNYPDNHGVIYLLRFLYYTCLTSIVFIYAYYIMIPLWAKERTKKVYLISAGFGAIATIIADFVFSFMHVSFYIRSDNFVHAVPGNTYILYISIMFVAVFVFAIRSRRRISTSTFKGIIGTTVISLALVIMQNWFRNNYWLTFSALIPILGVIFLFHTGSYDSATGASSEEVFFSEMKNALKGKKILVVNCVYIRGLDTLIEDSEEFKESYIRFIGDNVKSGLVCRMKNDKIIILNRKGFRKSGAAIEAESFEKCFGAMNLDYHIISCETNERLTTPEQYIGLVRTVATRIPNRTSYTVVDTDIDNFQKAEYILSELLDIYEKRDLDDPRVLVYCQPVLNIETGKYDTAEALMRLKLEKTGMVFPDQFIPVAEHSRTIHVMTLIILNKTCKFIKSLLDQGYNINRISVNFSVLDLQEKDFCEEVLRIIEDNQIPCDKIAAEITESRNTGDFEMVKPKIMQLNEKGICFYLDDFGTGYSNFERIMELPFQIVKFDRSLVIESAKSIDSRFMVGSFAKMFRHLHYRVLFEGVEDERDEQNCIEMQAQYLQGYKYSKPIPIEDLIKFVA